MPKNISDSHLKFAVLAADVAIFSWYDGELVVRLMEVDRPPHFTHVPGLPGGLVRPKETADETVRRLVVEKGGIEARECHVEQLKTYSAVDRDPRGRVVSVAYLALAPWPVAPFDKLPENPVEWQPIEKVFKQKLAYDHNTILRDALASLGERLRYTTIAGKLLPNAFTLFDLRLLYEKVLKRPIDKRNFIKKILSLNILKPLGRKETGRKARPAELYAFVSKKVELASML
jgi:8-oxo-dGTP diphosphatase